MDHDYVSSFVNAFLLYGLVGVGVLSVPVLAVAVPSQKEYYAEAQKVLGVPLPKPLGSSRPGTPLWGRVANSWAKIQAWSQISHSYEVLTFRPDYLLNHSLVMAASVVGFQACFVYTSMPTPFGELLFGSEEGGMRLANFVNMNLVALGSIVGPLSGILIDRAGGLSTMQGAQAAALVVVALSCSSGDWTRQALAVSGVNFFQVTNITMLMRYILSFASPTRVGTVSGLFTVTFSVVTIPCTLLFSWVVELLSDQGVGQYTLPTAAAACIGASNNS